MDSAKLFFSGGLAGAIGITSVYPIDLVKTRMQNQSNKIRYKNSIDCVYKTVRKEGFLGLFKGLRPQLLGVVPEKSIKLAVNDIMKEVVFNSNKNLITDILSGATAGFCQMVVTNPLEITKIRIQVHGEMNPTKSISLSSIYKELGFKGLYKGSRACSIRDSIFTGIYFPIYDRLKNRLSDEEGIIKPMNLVTAGAVSGLCASSVTTPLDVIKTRLQVKPRPGERKYNGIYDCYKKIVKHEGYRALFKGITPRVIRSAPQFGITLYCYEMLKDKI